MRFEVLIMQAGSRYNNLLPNITGYQTLSKSTSFAPCLDSKNYYIESLLSRTYPPARAIEMFNSSSRILLTKFSSQHLWLSVIPTLSFCFLPLAITFFHKHILHSFIWKLPTGKHRNSESLETETKHEFILSWYNSLVNYWQISCI